MSVVVFLDKVQRYARGLQGLRKNDVILVSYPKSGNTWVRFFLCNLLSTSEQDGETVDFHKVDSTMPELAINDLREPWPFKAFPRVVKTHNPWWFPFNGLRSIYVVRDPRDVMISYYHFVKNMKGSTLTEDFAGFLRHRKYGLQNWYRHYGSWKNKYGLLIKYEDLLADDVTEFRKVLDYLGAKYQECSFLEAVEKSRFKNLKKTVEEKGHSERGNFQSGFNFMRSGQSKQWMNTFSEADLKYYEELQAKYRQTLYE